MTNDIEVLTRKLEIEWLEGGFLHKLRDCEFDAAGYVRLESLLNSARQLDDTRSPTIDRDFVRLVWFIPQFVEWQVDRVVENGADTETVHGAASNIREMVGLVLGEP